MSEKICQHWWKSRKTLSGTQENLFFFTICWKSRHFCWILICKILSTNIFLLLNSQYFYSNDPRYSDGDIDQCDLGVQRLSSSVCPNPNHGTPLLPFTENIIYMYCHISKMSNEYMSSYQRKVSASETAYQHHKNGIIGCPDVTTGTRQIRQQLPTDQTTWYLLAGSNH